MSIFSTLLEKITGSAPAAQAAAPAPAPQAAPAAAAPAAAAPKQKVDVNATLAYMTQQSGQPSNWQSSIVDLMKLVGMDSSLANRKSLAQELGYTGDMDDSASMNIWLHQKVMDKLATSTV